MNRWLFICLLKVEGIDPEIGTKYDYNFKLKIPLPGTYEAANAKTTEIKEQIRKALKKEDINFFIKLDEIYNNGDSQIIPGEGITVIEIKIINYKKFKFPTIQPKLL